jgi:hypothetical protein
MKGVSADKFRKLGDACSYNERFEKLRWYRLAARAGDEEAKEYCFQQLGDDWDRELSPSVRISDLPKLALLRELWKNQQQYYGCFDEEKEEEEETRRVPWEFDALSGEEIVTKGYVDFFDGRAIKCDFTKETVDPTDYNRHAGPGTFQRVVESLREKQNKPTNSN